MTKNQLSYLAGIIDGEGYIGISKFNVKGRKSFYKARIIISNCNLELLQYINSFIDGHITKKTMYKNNWTQGYNLVLTYPEKWVKQIIPFLFGKRKKVELFSEAIKLLKKRDTKTKEIRYKRIEEINQLLRKKEWEI